MKLERLVIKNFRGLKDIRFDLPQAVSVIVGPNAMGKTTILEALRITKAFLMPSFSTETQEVLNTLGILNPHTQELNFYSIMADVTQPLEVEQTFRLEDSEIAAIQSNLGELVKSRIKNSLGMSGQNDLALVQLLSSPQGQMISAKATADLQNELKTLATSKTVSPGLIIDPTQKTARGKNLFDQETIALLAKISPRGTGLFNYFPADRSMPPGETAIQIGAADYAMQIKSHIALPAAKYSRLKQYIVNQYIFGDDARKVLIEDFALVFDRLLPGKKLHSLTMAHSGNLSVLIEEVKTGVKYDIDSMSSGEKGLLLTFFLMKRCTAAGGLVLIDEPELHLNPAVCKKILPFLVDEVLNPGHIQAIICTHSPEILGAAYERADCTLFHLRSAKDISPIHKKDKDEVFEALRKLGTQTSDVLFSKGGLFVEGIHDVELLEIGFADRTAGYKVVKLGGRNEIEKEIQKLQKAEAAGELITSQIFIFDLDRKPTALKDTDKIKILQWDRYCFENYLIDLDVIYEVAKSLSCKNPIESRGLLPEMLKQMAKDQIRGLVSRRVYATLEPDNSGLRPTEIDSLTSYNDVAGVLYKRLEKIKTSLATIDSEPWTKAFVAAATTAEKAEIQKWEESWASLCDGKRLLDTLYKHLGLNIPALDFKKKLLELAAHKKTPSWRVVDSLLSGVLS